MFQWKTNNLIWISNMDGIIKKIKKMSLLLLFVHHV